MEKHKALSVLLVAALLITIVPVFPMSLAASVDDLVFALNEGGESYCVSDCDSTASGSLNIPDTYNEKPVTVIGEYAFWQCNNLTGITIPGSVTDISTCAFVGCIGLESVTIPDSVTSIGDYAFSGCTGLESIAISDYVTDIGDYAFSDCTGLLAINVSAGNAIYSSENGVFFNKQKTRLISFPAGKLDANYSIPNTVTSIVDEAFKGCTNLTTVTISASVGSIGSKAFYKCTGLTAINVSDDNTVYSSEGGVFFNKLKAELIIYPIGRPDISYTIPSSVTSISSGAFRSCRYIESVTFQGSVTSIGNSMFEGCTSLTDISIPASVNLIDRQALNGCTSLREINIADNNATYSSENGVLFNKDKTEIVIYPEGRAETSYTIPSDVTRIGERAFYDCVNLTGVTIPGRVTSIGGYAFKGCTGINGFTIPQSVLSIENYAFNGCTGIESITIPQSVSNIDNGAFWGCTGLTEVTLPDNFTSIEGYLFYNCSNLERLSIPYTVESIGDFVFFGCSKLTAIDVNIFNSVYSSVDGVLFNSGKTELITYPVGRPDTSYTVPDTVESLANYAFYNSKTLESVIIPDSVTSIAYNSLRNCDNLTIHCNHGSFTEEFAISGGLRYVTVGNNLTFELNDGIETYKLTSCSSKAYGELTVPDEYNSSPVTSIGASAFNGCTELTGVTIPDSVTSIEAGAFTGCDNIILYCSENSSVKQYAADNGIACIVIDSNLSFALNDDGESYYIESCDDTVSGALAIPEKYLGKPVTSIDYEAFYYCTALTSVTIPDTVTDIWEWAFEGCSGLESVTIPSSVKNIDEGAFCECTGLTSITIPSSVENIGLYAFDGCTGLESFDVSEDNTMYASDGGVLFNKEKTVLINYPPSKSDTSYVIPSTVETIIEYAFYACSTLETVTIPQSVTGIGECAFGFCSSLTSINVNDANTAYSSVDGVLFNKDKTTLITYPEAKISTNYLIPATVTTLEADAFSYSTGLSGVTIPNSVDTISSGAFYECSNLTSVTIPTSVTSIESYAFEECTSLESITLPSSLTSIENDAFAYCSSLKSITIPGRVTRIDGGAFYDCSALESVIIEDGVESIATSAFDGCTALASITVPDSVTSIAVSAFDETAWLNNQADGLIYIGKIAYIYKGEMPENTSIVIADGTKAINESLFTYKARLNSITIPDSVTTIGDFAFRYCSALTSITIPDSVTSIGSYAFGGCIGVESIIIPDSVTSIEAGMFKECSALKSVTIPDSVTSIGSRAFEDCTSLESIKLPNSITVLDWSVFYNCSKLRNIIIPGSVTTIEYDALSRCLGLTGITIPASVTSIDEFAFDGRNNNLVFYCYENSTAHTFADVNNIEVRFISISPATVDTAVVAQNLLIPTVKEGEMALPNLVTAVDGFTVQGTPSYGSLYGTGSTVNVHDSSNNLVSTYTVAVEGDLDGSGYVDALDCMYAELASSGHYTLTDTEDPTGAYRAANDVNLDGLYNRTDFDLIMKKSLK